MDQLLNSLSKEVLTEQNVKEVSREAGVTAEETVAVVNNAIPALVNSLSQTATRSAGSERSSADLLNLLLQATSTNTSAQTSNASLGGSLLSTILGGNNNTNTLFNAVSSNTGVSSSGVSKILKYIAPALIAALVKKVLSGNKPAQTTGSNTSLLSALLGGQQQSQQTVTVKPKPTTTTQSSGVNLSDGLDMNDIMALLQGSQQQQQTQQSSQQSSGLSSLLSALTGQQQTQQTNQSSSGVNLSDGLDMNDIMALLQGSQQSQQNQQTVTVKPKPTATTQSSGVNLSDGIDMNDIMALLQGSQQQSQQTTTQQQSTGLNASSLLGLLGSLTSTNTANTTTTNNKKKKTSSSSSSSNGVDLSDGIDINDIIGLLGTMKK